MAIPKNISKEHIRKALTRIDSERKDRSLPAIRMSRKYLLRVKGIDYPPKLVISYANVYPNHIELDPNPKVFTTYMAQDYLSAKGYQIIQLSSAKRKIKQ
jgi:hypothetical protein